MSPWFTTFNCDVHKRESFKFPIIVFLQYLQFWDSFWSNRIHLFQFKVGEIYSTIYYLGLWVICRVEVYYHLRAIIVETIMWLHLEIEGISWENFNRKHLLRTNRWKIDINDLYLWYFNWIEARSSLVTI